MFHFYTPWNVKKTFGFLTFPESIEMENYKVFAEGNAEKYIGTLVFWGTKQTFGGIYLQTGGLGQQCKTV